MVLIKFPTMRTPVKYDVAFCGRKYNGSKSWESRKEIFMKYRVNRRTGDRISEIGMGTAYIVEADKNEAVRTRGDGHHYGRECRPDRADGK